MQRRELWETLVELIEAATPMDLSDWLWVTGFSLDLPVEMLVQSSGDELKLLVDSPSWRLPTGFSGRPGRLRIECSIGDEL